MSRSSVIRVASFVAALALIVIASDPANADSPHAGGDATDDGGSVIVVAPGTPGIPGSGTSPTPGSRSKSPVTCGYYTDDGTPIGDPAQFGFEPGTWIVVSCVDQGTGTEVSRNRVQWFPGIPLPVPQPTAAELAQIALGRLGVPLPAVQTWPSAGGTSLVNLPVWLHVENWAPLSASASAAGLTATITAEPVRVEGRMIDGAVTCEGEGSVWSQGADPQSSDCSFMYRHSSGVQTDGIYHNTGTIYWHLRWTATNGQGADLGELSRTSAFDLRVEESQALVVSAG